MSGRITAGITIELGREHLASYRIFMERNMTFQERYSQEQTWYGKVMIMEIYHLAKIHTDKDWTLIKTATDFGCSVGLVSENLKLADALHYNVHMFQIPTRQEALRKIRPRN